MSWPPSALHQAKKTPCSVKLTIIRSPLNERSGAVRAHLFGSWAVVRKSLQNVFPAALRRSISLIL